MSELPFPIVLLTGPPFECGRQHGVRFREEITDLFVALRREHGTAAHAAARARAASAWPAIQESAPDIAAEMQGIAEGAAVDPTEIVLNVGFEFFGDPAPVGCSAIACRGANGAIVAQNWDAPPALARTLVLFIHLGPKGFEQAVVASYGGLAWVGVNRHGLALVNNDLMLKSRRSGLPSQIVRRLVLGKQTVAEALAVLRALPHMAGRSYLLGDAGGNVAGVEVSAGAGVQVTEGQGPILHTNHVLAAAIADDEDEAALMRTYPSSRHRLEILRRRAAQVSSPDQVMAILRDRDGFPDSVSKAQSDREPTQTAFSIVMDCGGRALSLCPGSPAAYPYLPILLPRT